MIPVTRVARPMHTGRKMVDARSWGEGSWELVFNRYRACFARRSESWNWLVVMVVQQCECTSGRELYTEKRLQ